MTERSYHITSHHEPTNQRYHIQYREYATPFIKKKKTKNKRGKQSQKLLPLTYMFRLYFHSFL